MKSSLLVKFVLILLIYLFIEGFIYLGLLLLQKSYDIHYDPNISVLSDKQRLNLTNFVKRRIGEFTDWDPILGWVNSSKRNSAGMRDNREYARVPSGHTIRISAFGDSFTYGSDVKLADTWEKQLMVIDPSLEILNYGVGAYGLDQAYLRYLKVGTEYNPQIVFIGFMSENIARSVNVFRAFYTRWYRDVIFTKPRFKVKDGQFILLRNPLSTFEDYEYFLKNESEVLSKLGENDYHYQTKYNRGPLDFLPSVRLLKILNHTIRTRITDPIFNLKGMYNANSEAYLVTVKTFDAFYRKVLENGALPVIIIFPDISDQRRSRNNEKRRYTPLITYLQAKRYYYIDTLDALEPYESRLSVDDLVENWGHYSPLGNRIIARYIYRNLKNWGLTDLSKLKKTIEEQRKAMGATAR